jgi:hypothetical protein
MKKFFFFAIAAFALTVLAACTDTPNGSFSGLVTEMTDSVMVVDVNGSQKVLDIVDAQYSNGAVQPGDSVAVKCADGKASLIHLIPKASLEVNPEEMKDNELITRPATDEDVKAAEEYVEKVKASQSN